VTHPAPPQQLPTAIAKLVATGPAPEFADELMLFGRYVGSWDVVNVDVDEASGTPLRERDGEWHFSWILGGSGVQDVLYASGADAHRRGTTLRTYDHRADVWRCSWMIPAGEEWVHLIGREVDGRIELIGRSPDETRIERWTFSEITDNSFLWRGEVSRDRGKTWRLIQEMRATRRQE
jgi:hypothetical protein